MEFKPEILWDQLDSLEHLASTIFQYPAQYTCLHCRKALKVSVVKLGSAADEGAQVNQQMSGLISWLVKFPSTLRLRLKPEHFTALRQEKSVLVHGTCPACQKTVPFVLHMREQ